jgi:hypothetical protein
MTQLKFWMFVTKIFAVVCWVILILFLYNSEAEANAVLAQPFQPTSVNRMVSSSSLVTASTRFAGVTAANQSVYAVRAVEIGKASVKNAIKVRAFSPWGLSLVSALTVAGYVLDQQTGEIVLPGQPIDDRVAPPGKAYTAWYSTSHYSSTSYGVAMAFLTASSAALEQCLEFSSTSGTFGHGSFSLLTNHNSSNGCYGGKRGIDINLVDAPAGYTPDSIYTEENQPLSDDAAFDIFKELSPSEQVGLLSDPLTGFPDAANIPEFQQAADQISSNWNANNDGDPNTVPEPDPTEQTSEEPFPEEQPEQDICKANPDILACQELGETPDETPIDEQELPFDYQPVSFSGNASCP